MKLSAHLKTIGTMITGVLVLVTFSYYPTAFGILIILMCLAVVYAWIYMLFEIGDD